jgi:membrane-bound lytic murein transglycosylase D
VGLLKQISILLVAGVFFVPVAKANEQQQDYTAKPFTSSDTTIKKDSVPGLNDLKKGFKNLFVDNTLGGGISSRQLNPMAITFVQDYMAKNEKGLMKMKDWGKPYFDMMDAILMQHGLPKELKYLAVIESGLRYNVISWAGAVGPWALMPGTARMYGMTVTRQYDERTDYIKSTHVAARLLKDLFTQYGDWLLVIAAYNGGPGNVDKAIRQSGSKDFWTLQHKLPNESRNHVKKFISTHYIMEGEGGITTLTKGEAKDALLHPAGNLSKEEIDSSRVQPISGRYNSGVIVKYIAMDLAGFNRYNPGFDNIVANNGKYELRLPYSKMDIFLTNKFTILNESIQLLLNHANGKR